MSLTAPGLLSRAVDSNALFAEVTLRYDTDSGTFTRTETASRTNGSNTWDVNLDIPANTEFVLDIVWYDMADPERVNLTSLSRTFSTAGANDVLTLSFDFAEFDSSAFNIDSDRFTNLEERVNGTSPFINDDLIVDDAGVFRYEEGVVYTINPRASEQDTTPVIGARWRRLPTSSNNAIACGAQAGFDATLAAGSLEEACTTADNCTFDFDQVDPVSQTGTGIEFSVEVPPLQASVGLSYGLEITNSAQQVSFVDIEFCLIAINEAPVAVDDSFTVTEGIPFEVTADQGVNLLSNDTDDIDVSNMPLVVDTTPTRLPSMASTFTLRSDGGFSYLYDPVAANASNADLTDSFEYTITDGIFTSTASVTLDIVLIDRPPVQTREIPAQTAVVGIDTAFDLSSSFDDPEDSELTFSAVAQTLPPSGGLSVSDVGLFGGIAESGDEGTYVVEIVARDQTSSVAASFALEVIENQRPIARAIADLDDVAAGQVISIDAGRNFSDPEGEPLRFTLESRPDSGLQINRNSGLITGQIAEPGDYNITVSASDGITQPVSSEFTITRVPTPAPILSDPSPGSLRLSAQVSDSDSGSISFGNTGNAPLTFSVRSDQAWLTTNTDSGRLGVGDRDELVVSAECGQSVETRMGTLTIGGNGGEKTVSVSLECIEAQVAILGDPDPDVLSLSALVSDGDGNGSENSDSDTFSFSNVGNAELNYSVSSNQPWLSVSADSGSLNPGGRDQVDVTAACGPEVDTRMGTITIGGNGGEKTVSVTLECSEAQVAILDDPSPDSLSLAALVSDGEDDGSAQRDSGTFNFSNTGTAVLTYSVSSNQPWLSVSSTDGSLNPGDSDQVNVTAVCGRAVETRRGVITLGGNGGEKTVAVSLACSEAQIPILGDPDPQDINLAAQVSGGDGPGSSDSGAFRIGNVGTAELLIAVSSNQPWLSASTDSGSLAPGESRQVEVSAVCGSAVETRTGVITIGGNGGEQTVSVSLVCSEAPVA
ncbi:MAG: putative Ig domain-containing protein, partial [Granulosicoccus sp.]